MMALIMRAIIKLSMNRMQHHDHRDPKYSVDTS